MARKPGTNNKPANSKPTKTQGENMLVKKISVKDVVGNVKNLVKDGEISDETKIMRIFGVATGTKVGESQHGPWVKLLGTFRAQNLLADGETAVESSQAFLPDLITDAIIAQLENGENSVEFAYDVIVRPDETTAVGYIYGAESLIEASVDNPLDRLAAAVNK